MEVVEFVERSPGFATTPTGRTCLTVLSDEDGVIHLPSRDSDGARSPGRRLRGGLMPATRHGR
jgi:hypothetical protein